MTKKDYELIANAINKSFDRNTNFSSEYNQGICEVVAELIVDLHWENPLFNGEKFKKSCMPK